MPRPKLYLESPERHESSWTGAALVETFDCEGYTSMNQDKVRNRVYQRAIEAAVAAGHHRFLEIGPGASALLTKMVLSATPPAGAKKSQLPSVLAAEANPKSAEAASKALQGDPRLANRVKIYTGLSTDGAFVTLACKTKPHSLLQEVFGFLASSEGVIQALAEMEKSVFHNTAHRPWNIPSLAASFGVLTNVQKEHIMRNTELQLARKFMLARRLPFSAGSVIEGKKHVQVSGASVAGLHAEAGGAGWGAVATGDCNRVPLGSTLHNSFCLEHFDFSKPLEPQLLQSRSAVFTCNTPDCTINSISFFLWVGFIEEVSPPPEAASSCSTSSSSCSSSSSSSVSEARVSASPPPAAAADVTDEGQSAAASHSGSSRSSGAGADGGSSAATASAYDSETAASGDESAPSGTDSSCTSEPARKRQRRMQRWQHESALTNYPYGCPGLCSDDLHAVQTLRGNSFSSCSIDGDACTSNWRNLIVWLPRPVTLQPGQRITVASEVDLRQPTPQYRLRVQVQQAPQKQQGQASPEPSSSSSSSAASSSAPSAEGAQQLFACEIVLDQLYPYFVSADSSSDAVIDSWLEGRAGAA